MKKKSQTPVLPIVIAGVVAGFCAIPANGSTLEPWVCTGLTIVVGLFARQRALRERPTIVAAPSRARAAAEYEPVS